MADLTPAGDLTLHRLRVAARTKIGAQVLHDADIRQIEDLMLDGMVYELRSFLYADKLAEQEVTAPFTTSVPFEQVVKIQPPDISLRLNAAGWVMLVGGIVGTVLTGAAWIVLLALLLAAIALLGNGLDRDPVEVPVMGHATVSGQATVNIRHFATFPDNGRVYPKELGDVVRYSQVDPPSVYCDGGDE